MKKPNYPLYETTVFEDFRVMTENVAKKYPERFLVIDASGSKEQTHEKVISALKEKGII